jgi:catechol 2,3-dioxygenase-like lactoylglutathione lyase family enzyme
MPIPWGRVPTRLTLLEFRVAKLTYACVLTRNIEALAGFYTEILRTQPSWSGPYAEFSTQPGIFCLWALDAYVEIAGTAALPESGTGRVMLEFEVDDVDAEYARLQQLPGIKLDFIIPPTTMAWGNRSIYIRDPDGNLVNFFTHVGSAS